MRKTTILNTNTVYIGSNPGDIYTVGAADKYTCCGLKGYGVDIYYDADAKKPTEYMVKAATKKALKLKLREIKKIRPAGSINDYLKFYKDKEYGTQTYHHHVEGIARAIKECEGLLESLK